MKRLWKTDKLVEKDKAMMYNGPVEMPQKYPPSYDLHGTTMEEQFKAGGIQVFNGGAAWPLDMEKTDIQIEDIAHALSMKVRFTGHCIEPYSVAQHSCHVCDLVPEEDKHEGLMHDAAEYVLPDLPSPVKGLPEVRAWFKPIEHQAEKAIAKRFNLRLPFPPSIKLADNGMVLFERSKILKPAKFPWMAWTVPGDPAFISDFEVWGWKRAKHEFLARAARLEIR